MIRKVMAVCLLLALFALAGSAAALADDSLLEISNLEELKAFRDRVNQGETFAGWTVRLTEDINLAGENWEPIGGYDAGKVFMGTFDGNDKTISNMTITKTDEASANLRLGLFSHIKNATIQKLKIKNASITAAGDDVRAGVLVCTANYNSAQSNANATIANTVKGVVIDGGMIDIDAKSIAYGAGTAAYSYTVDMDNVDVSDLTINLDAPGGGVRAGGAIAYLYNQHGQNNISGTGIESTLDNVNIKNVTISATSGNEDAGALIGGMIGYAYRGNLEINGNGGASVISNLKISADVGTSGVDAGGLIGYSYKQGDNYHWSDSEGCYVTDNMTVNNVTVSNLELDVATKNTSATHAGGLIAWNQSFSEVSNCSVSGSITETTEDGKPNTGSEIGGFVGIVHDRSQTYTDCSADVDVTGMGKAGGFAGNTTVNGHATMNAVFDNCSAEGVVSGVSAGGFSGYVNLHTGKEGVLDGCSFEGTVYGTDVAGGLIGDVRDGNKDVVFRNTNTVNATVIGKTANADMDPSEASYKPDATYRLKGRQSVVDLRAASNEDVVVGKNGDVKIYGGTYDNDVGGLVAKGYACVDNGDGTFTVVKLSIAAGLPQTGDGTNLVLWLAAALSSAAFLAARRMRRVN